MGSPVSIIVSDTQMEDLEELNPDIQFTTEGDGDGVLAFLDTNSEKARWLPENHHLPKSDPH